jgi:hypothetical protein
MNTIYLGPYRQNDINGIWSKNILDTLIPACNNSLTARPIYLSTKHTSPKYNFTLIEQSEKNICEKYERIIQHTDPERIIVNKQLVNICIPIINNELLSNQSLDNLRACDTILVDSEINLQKLSAILQTNNIELFGYNVDLNYGNSNYDFGIYSHMKKLYLIADYDLNADLYKDLIINFTLLAQNYDNICLVLFVLDGDNRVWSTIQQLIDNSYTSLGILNKLKKICMIPILSNIENIVSCHKICDIYLNINDDTRSSASSAYAKALGKPVIDHQELSFNMTPVRNSKISTRWFDAPSSQSIAMSIHNKLTSKNHSDLSIPNIKPLESFL